MTNAGLSLHIGRFGIYKTTELSLTYEITNIL